MCASTTPPGSSEPSPPAAARWWTGQSGSALEELDDEACAELLRSQEVGRLVISGSPPQVFPMNYVVEGRSLVMRTAPGAKLDGLRRQAEVAFEIDGVDTATHSGWSVVVTGPITEDVQLHREPDGVTPEPWSEGVKAYRLRLEPTTVTGRRVGADGPREGPGGR